MAMDRLPGIARIARHMRALADAPLEGATFRKACIGFGWVQEAEGYPGEEQSYVAFSLPGSELKLNVSLTDGVVTLAVLPLMFWEDCDPEFDYETEAAYRRARTTFDRRYVKALEQAEAVLGPPLRVWVEDDEDRFQKAVWQGEVCLLVLQQDDYDVQFGFDINFLLQPHVGPLPERLELLV